MKTTPAQDRITVKKGEVKFISAEEVKKKLRKKKTKWFVRFVGKRYKEIHLIHIYEFEDFEKQKQLLKDLILGQDNYPKEDFNKNNLITNIPVPTIIYQNDYTIYGAGPLY